MKNFLILSLFICSLTACGAKVSVTADAAAAAEDDTVVYDNFFVLDGVPYEVTSATIYYWNTERYVALKTAGSDRLTLNFETITGEIPVGSWTTFDTNGVSDLVHYDGSTSYDLVDFTPSGTILITGTDGGTLTVAGSVDYNDGGAKSASFYYSGSYAYEED